MRRLFLPIAMVIVAACGGAVAETTTTGAAATTTTATTTTTPTTTTTLPPRELFGGAFQQVLGTGPNAWESVFMDPGGVLRSDDTWYMFYNGIDDWPSEVHVGLATSSDGITWERTSDQWVFTGAGVDWVPVTMFVSSAIVLDDGTWALYFYTVESPGTPTGNEIGMATAPGPEGPWTALPGPVLTLGPEGAWDDNGVTNPSVMRVDGGYWMYYDGNRGDLASEGDRSIGLATSDDGYTWTKYDDPATSDGAFAVSDPVMIVGDDGAWDAGRVFDPGVVITDDGFVMTYFTHVPDQRNARVDYQIGVARSDDGINWVKDRDNPVLSSTRWGFQGIYLSTLVHADGRYLLFFDVARGIGGGTAVWVMEHEGMLPS